MDGKRRSLQYKMGIEVLSFRVGDLQVAILQDPEIVEALIAELEAGAPISRNVLQALGLLEEVQTNKGTAYSQRKGDVVNVGTKRVTHRVRNYDKRIDRRVMHIAKLELTLSKQQAMAMGGLGPGGFASREEYIQALAIDLRQFCANADWETFGHCGGGGLGGEDLGPPLQQLPIEQQRTLR